jgi:putative heme transporter
MGKNTKRLTFKKVINYITIVALVGLVYVLRHQIVDTLNNLQNVKPWAIAIMPLLQVGNYMAYADFYKRMLHILGDKVGRKELVKIQLELNFINNVFPSGGVSGVSYFGVRLKDVGVSPAKATIVQMFKFIILYLSFQVLLFFGLLMLAIGGKANGLLLLFSGSLSTLLIIGTLASAYILASERRINSFFVFFTQIANKVIHVVRPKHPETINIDNVRKLFSEVHQNYMLIKSKAWQLKKPFLLTLAANITEVSTIYMVYVASGSLVNPGAVIIGYAVANFAGLVSVLPGGVGVYETLMVLVTSAGGVPAELAISVTIMYRVLNMLIQLPPGYYYYRKHMRRS